MKRIRDLAILLAVVTLVTATGTDFAYAASAGRERAVLDLPETEEMQEAADCRTGSVSTEMTGGEGKQPAAVLKSVNVEYDLERQILSVSWKGEHIDSAVVFQDGVKLGTVQGDDMFSKELALEPSSRHIYKITAYNSDGEEGNSKSVDLLVDNRTACITSVDAWYEETRGAVVVNWESVYTDSVDILLNDEEIVKGCRADQYVFPCILQPGADYLVTVIPYNAQKQEGESQAEAVSTGFFDVPDKPVLKSSSQPVVDDEGNFTGFYKPAVEVSIEAQAGAVYEVYRAKKNRKGAYNWIGSVKAAKEGVCTYTDRTAGMGTYYYKVLRKISEDLYISQALYTGLSEAAQITVLVPKARVSAKLTEKDTIRLSLASDSEIVSGYVIYRKTGNQAYRKLATVSGAVYEDTDVKFNTRYSYKVKAYYYDKNTGKKTYGVCSKVHTVRNTVGTLKAEAAAVSEDTIKLSWSKAANAEGYEVYYRTGIQGDSYKLLTVTTGLSVKAKLKNGRKYSFLIQAYRKNQTGKNYFSDATVSLRTGFCRPGNLRVIKTSYSFDEKTGALTQKSRLKWNRVFGADGYYVEYYDKKTGKYLQVADLGKNTRTAYTVTNTVESDLAAVVYRIRAYQGERVLAGESITVAGRLGTPGQVRVKKSKDGVRVSFQKVMAAETYRIYRSNGGKPVLVGETAKTVFTDKGLDTGVSYSYYVQAVSRTRNCTGAYSEPVEYTLPPEKVTGFLAKNTHAGQAQLQWRNVSGAKSYIIYFCGEADGTYQKLAEVKAGTVKYTHTKRTAGTTCYYKITAVQSNGAGIRMESRATAARVQIIK